MDRPVNVSHRVVHSDPGGDQDGASLVGIKGQVRARAGRKDLGRGDAGIHRVGIRHRDGQGGQGHRCSISLKADKGSCALTAKKLKIGSYRLVASYAGNAHFFGSASGRVSLTVTK